MSEVKVPKQVQEQEAKANEMAQQAAEQQQQQQQQQQAQPANQQTPKAEPAKNNGEGQLSPEEEAALYKQRYQSLRGMYESQVPQYQEQIKFLQDLLSKTQPDDSSQDSESVADLIFGEVEIKEDEVKDYGSDFFDVVGRQAKLATKDGFEYMANRIAQLEDTLRQLSTGQQQVAHSTFEAQLSTLVPNWREIDTNPQFLEWLQSSDEFTGQSKFNLLRSAVRDGDAQRASVFFNTWLQQTQAQVSQQATPSAQSQGMAVAATPSVAQQPESVTASQASSSGRVYTQKDIADFYADIRKGKYNGRESEVQAIEADIQKAMVEGRLIA